MKHKKPTNPFDEWIDSIGSLELSKKLKISRTTINHWRARRCDPRVNQMRQLRKMSKGLITYEHMIDRDMIGFKHLKKKKPKKEIRI